METKEIIKGIIEKLATGAITQQEANEILEGLLVTTVCKYYPDCEIKKEPFTECFSNIFCEKKNN